MLFAVVTGYVIAFLINMRVSWRIWPRIAVSGAMF
jgi:hypothetical protein